MASISALPVTNRTVLQLAVPIMLSNVSQPLIGVVNTAVVGRLPEPFYIGAIAIGAVIFSFLFWGFGFLRLSTGGLSAQAVGARDSQELGAVLLRSLMIAGVCGAGVLLAAPLLRGLSFDLIGGSVEIRHNGEIYFNYRIWAAPFAFVNYSVMGWFVGQGRTRVTLLIQLVLNLTNMALSVFFVLTLGMTTDGVGLAALLAEVTAAALALGLTWRRWQALGLHVSRARIFDTKAFTTTIAMNGDVMIRTLMLLSAFAWFTARGARSGDVFIAANALLMNLFEMSAYMIDGFAYASEALVGQSVGARDRPQFRAAIWLTSLWALVFAVAFSVLIAFFGGPFIDLLTTNPEVRETARHYVLWAALAPLLGTVCFQFDGIFTGAMATRDMRNMMILSLVVFLIAWYLLEAPFGNHGLWAALNIFFVARGVTFASRMPGIERKAFGQAF